MIGIDEAGRLYNHNRIVGVLLLLAILGIGFFPINFALQYRIPAALIAVGLMTLNGAYVESRMRTQRARTVHGTTESAPSIFHSREGAVRSLRRYEGLQCEIVWAKRFRVIDDNPGAEQLAEYLKELPEEAGWVITSYREEDMKQDSVSGVADDVITLGWWRLEQQDAFATLLVCLTFTLDLTSKLKIGIDSEHPKDRLPRIVVWSRGLIP